MQPYQVPSASTNTGNPGKMRKVGEFEIDFSQLSLLRESGKQIAMNLAATKMGCWLILD